MSPTRLIRSLSSLLFLCAAFVPFKAMPQPKAHSQSAQQAAAKPKVKETTASNSSVHQDEGQRVFEQNCSRCHTAPDGFSSRISGTVVRHMRVRASLSQHDEQELLRFLNP
jgi:mono/diheme cytochrome c family protein